MVSSHAGAHEIGHSLKVVETVMEIAEVAWKAYEYHHGKVFTVDQLEREVGNETIREEEEESDLVKVKEENRRLKAVLGENLNLLHSLSKSPVVSADCLEDVSFFCIIFVSY